MATDITAITDSVNVGYTKAGRQFRDMFNVIPFTAGVLLTSLAAEVGSQADIDVPGAALGDFVLVSIGVDTTGLLINAYVSAANVVTLSIYNMEGTDANATLATTAKTLKGVILQPTSGLLK